MPLANSPRQITEKIELTEEKIKLAQPIIQNNFFQITKHDARNSTKVCNSFNSEQKQQVIKMK